MCSSPSLHGLFFIWYQRPDWDDARGPTRTDTGGSAQVLADDRQVHALSRRADVRPGSASARPCIRLFVAVDLPAVRRPASCRSRSRRRRCSSASAARRVRDRAPRHRSERVAIAAAAATALFPPIPYFGALVMTEVWTTLLFTVSMWLRDRAPSRRRGRVAIRLRSACCSR